MKVPRYKSSGGSTPKAQATGTTADVRSLGSNLVASGKQVDAIGQNIIEKDRRLDAEMARMRTENEKLASNNAYARKQAEIDESLIGVTDEDEIQKGVESLAKASSDASALIKDEGARNRWSLQNEGNVINSSVQIKNRARATLGADYKTGLDMTYNNSITDSVNNPENVARNYGAFNESLTAGVEQKFISETQAEKARQEWQKEFQDRDLDSKIVKDPEGMLELLESDAYELDSEIKEKKINEANAEIKKQAGIREYQGKLEQHERSVQVGTALAANPFAFTPAEIDRMNISNTAKTQYKKMIKLDPTVVRNVEWRINKLNEQQLKLFKDNGGLRGFDSKEKLAAADRWLSDVNELAANGWITESSRNSQARLVGTIMEDLPLMAKYEKAYNSIKDEAIKNDPINWEAGVVGSIGRLVNAMERGTLAKETEDIRVEMTLASNTGMTEETARQQIKEESTPQQVQPVRVTLSLQDGRAVGSATVSD